MQTKRRQALEARILEDLKGLGYRGTSGSGNQLGDGDVKSFYINIGHTQFGFECKDRGVQEHHGVSAADWKKAKLQIRAAGFDPVFVTRNKNGEILAHIGWEDFIELLEKAIAYDSNV